MNCCKLGIVCKWVSKEQRKKEEEVQETRMIVRNRETVSEVYNETLSR